MTETVQHHLDSFADALDTGDLDRAATHATAVETTDDPPRDLLESLQGALVAKRDAFARTVLASLRRRYQRTTADEESRQFRGHLAREQYARRDGEFQTLSTHGAQAASTTGDRGALLSEAAIFLERKTSNDDLRSDLVNHTKRLLFREEQLRTKAEHATTVIEETDIPAAPRILEARLSPKTVLTGGKATAEVTVENVGDAAASSVVLTATSGNGGLDVTPSTVDVGSLSARERTATQFEVSPATEGSGRFLANLALLADEEFVSGQQMTLVVSDEPPSVAAAFDTNDNHVIDTREVQQAVYHWDQETPVSRLDGRVLDAEDVRSVVAAWAEARFV